MHRQTDITPREMQLLEILSAGSSNEEISQFLDISINTVKYHLKRIYRKLNIKNRVEAASYYRALQLQQKNQFQQQ